MQCIVPFCESTSHQESTGITFHEFPSEERLRAAWLKALGRQDARLPDSAVVCSQHFLNEDVYVTESGVRQICPGAVPSTALITKGHLELIKRENIKTELVTSPLEADDCDSDMQRDENIKSELVMSPLEADDCDSDMKRDENIKTELVMSPLEADDCDSVMKHDENIKTELVTSPLEADDCDSDMKHDDVNDQSAPEEFDNVLVKIERVSPSIKIEMEVCTEGDGEGCSMLSLDPLKCERDDWSERAAAAPAPSSDTDEEEKHKELKKELKRKRNCERQRAYYHRQKDLKKNEEKKKKKVPKTNAERQREFRQRKAEKSYVDIEEKLKELKKERKRNRERQRAYYQRQKDLKKNEEKIKKKVPKTNAERQREFRQRKAEKSYVDMKRRKLCSNEENVQGRAVENIENTQEHRNSWRW